MTAASLFMLMASGFGDEPWWRVGPLRDDTPYLLLPPVRGVYYPTYYRDFYDRYYSYPEEYYYPYYGSSFGESNSNASTVIIIDNTVVLDASNGGVIQNVTVAQTPDTGSTTGVQQAQ